ncbi:glycosyl hydrolase family 65 protein [Mesoplasma photuris]|uniref:glycosyl hydrolase family 65 protein n=1 Tax=Mesoplasma photuris TaxID=217731 RepID=UPI0004E16E3D|nr:glycosyl hydrolase family 65 protein [Mesoplasma photuris]
MEKINYNKLIDGEKNWAIEETSFDINNQGKFETIFSLGNGYLGLRAVTEEKYENRHYGLFIGGTFNLPKGNEVPELPNGADILNMEFIIDNKKFSILDGNINNYSRYLNLKNGQLIREFNWTSEDTKLNFDFKFESFTSFDNIHLICQRVTIKSLKGSSEITFIGGIDGQTTNSGTQHFEDYDTQFKNSKIQQYVFKTDESKISFYYNRSFNFFKNKKKIEKITNYLLSVYGYDRRKVFQEFDLDIEEGETLTIESFSTVETTRDFDWNYKADYDEILEIQSKHLEKVLNNGFEDALLKHTTKFKGNLWKNSVNIKSKNDLDILFTRMANYQLYKVTPQFDKRLNLDAKGWVGEEYKGHTFWDTEIYILPFYIYTDPQKARALLEHRYFVKPSAHIKAKLNGQFGAMWPWETSWVEDGETCPTWGEVDFKTGKRMKVWAAFNELHISADIMWAIDMYFRQTNDQDFMDKYGYEMLFDTAIFWANIAKENQQGKFEILNVTGPNEYKENIDNNIFTNYMVKYALENTLQHYLKLKENNPKLLNKISEKIGLIKHLDLIIKCNENMYLPEKNDNGIYPENDTFLNLKNLEKMNYYKENKGSIWKEYTANDINEYQVLKQADIVALFYTHLEKFDFNDVINNWKYYEERTLHSSSLSLSMHSVTAALIGEKKLSYKFFQKAIGVDYGMNMNSSNNGIHTAAIGGIIKCLTEGFGGIRINNILEINPKLPLEIEELEYNFHYLNNKFRIKITNNEIVLHRLSGNDKIKFLVNKEEKIIDKNEKEKEISY